jgi:periplasmic divalent cation tolerance protein
VTISIIHVNAGEIAEARRIGRNLVDSRLAAAVNVIDGISSIYRWDGTVRQRDEAQLIIKTRTDLVGKVIARVRELHSYECPGIIVLPVVDGNPEYLDWVARETDGV